MKSLSQGAYAALIGSGRLFKVLESKKRDDDIWYEFVCFLDDPRHPEWFTDPVIQPNCRELTCDELKAVENGFATLEAWLKYNKQI